eukprot:3839889-Amphidinium_carterae.1
MSFVLHSRVRWKINNTKALYEQKQGFSEVLSSLNLTSVLKTICETLNHYSMHSGMKRAD